MAQTLFPRNNGQDGSTFTGGAVTTPILFPDGTAAAPAMSFSSDTDTGIYRPAANTIGFAAAGSALFGLSISSGTVLHTLAPNSPGQTFDVSITGSDAGVHAWDFKVDNTSILLIGALGNGAGSITSQTISMTATVGHNFTVTGGNSAFTGSYGTSGSSSSPIIGLNLALSAGFTGGGLTNVIISDNTVAGTGTTYTSDVTAGGSSYRPGGNRGTFNGAHVSTTGHNTGALNTASGGAMNYGSWNTSTGSKAAANNVGVFGTALNGGGGGATQHGGFFTLRDAAVAPVLGTSAALVADNDSQTSAIFSARDNNTAVFTVADFGLIVHAPTATTSGVFAPYTFTAAASTGGTASTPWADYAINLAATKTWATGNHTQPQADFLIAGRTYAFVGSSSVQEAATFAINAGPLGGTNASITASRQIELRTWVSNAANSTANAVFLMPSLANGVGSTIAHAGLIFDASGGNPVNLGNQTASTNVVASIAILPMTFTSTTNTRTIGVLTGAYYGAPIVGSNISATAGPYASYHNGNVRVAGSVLVGLNAAGSSAVNVLALSNSATAPSNSVDMAQLYSVDLSADNATLGIFTETAVAADIALASTNSLTVKINGTNYKIPLTAA